MPQLTFNVTYKINLTEDDIAEVKKLIAAYKMAAACKLLM